MGTQSTEISLIETLAEFQFPAGAARNPAEVQRFIEEHSFLVPLLQEIRVKLHDYFADSSVSLEIAADPDEPGREQAVVAVATDLSPSDAVDRLGRFDRDWWLNNLDRAQGRICVDVEFK